MISAARVSLRAFRVLARLGLRVTGLDVASSGGTEPGYSPRLGSSGRTRRGAGRKSAAGRAAATRSPLQGA